MYIKQVAASVRLRHVFAQAFSNKHSTMSVRIRHADDFFVLPKHESRLGEQIFFSKIGL